MPDFTRKGTTLTTLEIDCQSYCSYSTHDVHDIWRRGLLQLAHLTRLTLVGRPTSKIKAGALWLADPGSLDQKLDFLLHEALVLQHVKVLTLGYWVLPATPFISKVQSAFPVLRRLHLNGVALLSHDLRQGEGLWNQILAALRQSGRMSMVVREPKVCIQSRAVDFEVVTMRKPARLVIEQGIVNRVGDAVDATMV